jgi:hypothetical protein
MWFDEICRALDVFFRQYEHGRRQEYQDVYIDKQGVEIHYQDVFILPDSRVGKLR